MENKLLKIRIICKIKGYFRIRTQKSQGCFRQENKRGGGIEIDKIENGVKNQVTQW